MAWPLVEEFFFAASLIYTCVEALTVRLIVALLKKFGDVIIIIILNYFMNHIVILTNISL